MKCRVYDVQEFLWLIILDFCVNVHSCFTIFMPSQILNCLRIDPEIEKIGDIGVSELVRRYLEIKAIYYFGIVLLRAAQRWRNRVLKCSVHLHMCKYPHDTCKTRKALQIHGFCRVVYTQ